MVTIASSLTKKLKRQNHLRQGRNIHVNILRQEGHIKRFFITPMTAADGAHIDFSLTIGFWSLPPQNCVANSFEVNCSASRGFHWDSLHLKDKCVRSKRAASSAACRHLFSVNTAFEGLDDL
jgi:hypothetical protein